MSYTFNHPLPLSHIRLRLSLSLCDDDCLIKSRVEVTKKMDKVMDLDEGGEERKTHAKRTLDINIVPFSSSSSPSS